MGGVDSPAQGHKEDFQQRWASSSDPEVQVCNQGTKAPFICSTASLEEILETHIHMKSEK